jgi:hypothetical protein
VAPVLLRRVKNEIGKFAYWLGLVRVMPGCAGSVIFVESCAPKLVQRPITLSRDYNNHTPCETKGNFILVLVIGFLEDDSF